MFNKYQSINQDREYLKQKRERSMLSRREFFQCACGLGTLSYLFSYKPGNALSGHEKGQKYMETLQFGLVADVHYADKDRWNNRYYRKSLEKLKLCMETMNREKLDLLIHLGDLVDAGENVDQEFSYLKSILSVYRFNGDEMYVRCRTQTADGNCAWTQAVFLNDR
ncbi:unnamed protein product [marine sediment metagenome]|uniref:Calcineurin-like phosphoesterase domain-containing protein n=1 Tax=marine sediment metagenome TaxID=412755 RepID=X1PQG8_9ZZZZ